MNPPPPMFPAWGYVTVSASATPTEASIALPPSLRMRLPIADAVGQNDTTQPAFLNCISVSWATSTHVPRNPRGVNNWACDLIGWQLADRSGLSSRHRGHAEAGRRHRHRRAARDLDRDDAVLSGNPRSPDRGACDRAGR